MLASKMHSALFISFVIVGIYLRDTTAAPSGGDNSYVNNRPIIGILTQEVTDDYNEERENTYDSYIAASYVKYIESAGARVVPIWINKEEDYYEEILSKINGVLFPGGNADFNQSRGYADAGEIIYKIATKYNENGNYFPIWGTCLGFELLTYLAANRFEHRTVCSSHDQPLPLQFTADFENSRLFQNAPADIINILSRENVTGNWHSLCVTKEGLIKANLTNVIRVMSVNYDKNYKRFISSLEHVTLPFYGVQFHPEKNAFEWKEDSKIPHTYDSVRVGNYFADFFVNEARKNHHKFSGKEEENKALIYNYNPYFTGINSSYFTQVYIFKEKETIDWTTNYVVTQIIENSQIPGNS